MNAMLFKFLQAENFQGNSNVALHKLEFEGESCLLVFGWIIVVSVPFSSSVFSFKLVDGSCQCFL